MQHVYKIALILVLFLAFGGCREDEDTIVPEIQFFEPQPFSIINLPDTLDIRVNVRDDQNLTMVTLNLLDDENIPVTQVRNYYPYSTEFLLQASLVLDSELLTSGAYFIKVSAFDGYNSVSEYLQITIKEIPDQVLAFVAVTAPLSFTSGLYRLNPDYEIDSVVYINDKCELSGSNSNYGQFFFVSDQPSVMTAYDVISFDQAWEEASNPPRPLFTCLYNDKDCFFSTANGDAGIIDNDGHVVLRTPAYADKVIKSLTADENYIYAGHQSLSGDINQLTIYYRVTGEIKMQQFLSAEILGLVPLSDEIMVFMLSGSDIVLLIYDPEDMEITNTLTLQGEVFRSAEKVSDAQIFILTDRCVISYYPQNEKFVDFTNQPYDFCRYEKLDDAVFLGKENKVERFGRYSGDLLNTITFDEHVLDFQIFYNR